MSNSKIIRLLVKAAAWSMAVFLGTCLLILIGFYGFRGKIYNRIITTVNENRPGELQVDHIHIAPLGFYPFLAIRMDSVAFYEYQTDIALEPVLPVLEFETLYIGFKYKNLLKGDFRLGGISLENGQINLLVGQDSTLNLQKGLRAYEKPPGDKAGRDRDPLGKLDLVELSNIAVHQANELTGEEWDLRLREVTNYYEEHGDTVKASLRGDVDIISITANDKKLLSQKKFSMDLDYLWSLGSLNGFIDSGTVSLGRANLNVRGTFYAGVPAGYNLHFFIDRKGLDTIDINDPNTFITADSRGPGKIYVDGTVRGSTLDKIPWAEAEIRVENLAIDDPLGDSTIHDLNLTGYFATGDSADLSEAQLVIDRMEFMAGTDHHEGRLEIRNFVRPQVSIDLDSRIEMRDLDKYFDFDVITDLGGFVEVSAKVDGLLDFEHQKILEDAGSMEIHFDDLSFLIPGRGQYIDAINGSIILVEDGIYLDGLTILSGTNDLLINGNISNILYLLSDEDASVQGTLDVKAGQLDVQALKAKDTVLLLEGIGVMEDLALNLKISTTSKELKDPGFLPDGTLSIDSLSFKTSFLTDMVSYSGIFEVKEDMGQNMLRIQDMNIRSGDNDLSVSGMLISPIDPQDPEISPVKGKLSLQADRLALSAIFAYDSILASAYKEVISNADIRLSYETTLENLVDNWYLPRGRISLDHFSANLLNRADIRNAGGVLTVTNDRVQFDSLHGIYGESELAFSAYVNNYPGLFVTDSILEIDMGFSASSDLVRANDFFTYKKNFYLLGKYRGEYLENFALAANFHYVNQDFFEAEALPDASIEITKLQWVTSYDGLFFRDFYVRLVREGKDLGLYDLRGKIGQSDFAFNAYLKNFTPFADSTLSELSASFKVKAGYLDLNELTGIKFPKAEQPRFNPFKFIYHDLALELDIEKLTYQDFVVRNILGNLSTERSHKIHLDRFSLETAGGKLQIHADLDTDNPEDVFMSSRIMAKDIHIDNILLNFRLKEEDVSPGEYFKGILHVEAISEVHMDPGFRIDLAQTSADLDFTLKDGQILDYPPMQELARYFGDKDLTNVRFEGKAKNIVVEDGLIRVPRMAVNSTLGHLYFTGRYSLDGGIEYIFEVPFRLVASTAWGMLVRRSREEGAAEDELQTPSRGAYVTLRLLSREEGGYELKLGKGKRERRKEERRSKRESGRTRP